MNQQTFEKLTSIHPANAAYCKDSVVQIEGQTFYVNQTQILLRYKDDKNCYFINYDDVLSSTEEIDSLFPGLIVDFEGVLKKPDVFLDPSQITTNILKPMIDAPGIYAFLTKNGRYIPDTSLSSARWGHLVFFSYEEGFVSLFERLREEIMQ